MGRPPNPTLADLLRDSTHIDDLPSNMIPPLLAQLSALQHALAARLVSVTQTENEIREAVKRDRLLTPAEAATKLGVSRNWLYRNARSSPLRFVSGTGTCGSASRGSSGIFGSGRDGSGNVDLGAAFSGSLGRGAFLGYMGG